VQHLLDIMTGLHTLAIYATDDFRRKIPVYSLSTAVFRKINPQLILDAGTMRVLLPFQRLRVDQDSRLIPQMLGTSQAIQEPLLPNLRDIELNDESTEGDQSPQPFHVFKDWITPRLNSPCCNIGPSNLPDSPFMRFLQIHATLLRGLTLDTHTSAPISDILPLCSNLQFLRVRFFSSFDLLSVPPHLKLEMLEVYQRLWTRGESAQPYLDQFEKFTSSWRTQFPNLRVVKLVGCYDVPMGVDMFGMHFCTEDSFYTVRMKRRHAHARRSVLIQTTVR